MTWTGAAGRGMETAGCEQQVVGQGQQDLGGRTRDNVGPGCGTWEGSGGRCGQQDVGQKTAVAGHYTWDIGVGHGTMWNTGWGIWAWDMGQQGQ